MKSHAVKVDIVADLVCPWCWLGKRYWDAALERASGIKVETQWRPFQLDPTLPREGAPYRDYMKAKFSGENAERWKQMREYLESAAPDVGIAFNFDRLTTRPNTLNAHRVMRWAAGQGRAEAAAESLFKSFFDLGQDIGDPAVLADAAAEAGLDKDVVADLLATDSDEAAVLEEEQFFRNLGVSGVPTYIFNGRFAISGAQEPEVLANAIREAATQPAEEE
jgi:predicted DsbA family dithiol-disulfide isomerase